MAYDAFISYSHAVDGQLAPALQVGLQHLARRWHQRWALRVFRDETGLAVNPHLWASIAAALDDSSYFVLLASPEAAASPWVNKELEYFCGIHPPQAILIVLTDGTLSWDAAGSSYHPQLSSALPPALAGRFTEEPRHLDLRWAREETELDLRHSSFRSAVADLAAPMHHLAKDELEGEDVRRHRHTVRLARGVASVLVVLLALSLALGAVAEGQRAVAHHQAGLARRQADIARHQTDVARQQTGVARRAATTAAAQKLAAQASNLAHAGRTDLGLLLAVEANRLDPGRETRASLLSTLVDQPALQRELHGLTGATTTPMFSPDGRTVAASSDTGETMVWDVQTGRPLPHQPKKTTNATGVAVAGFADSGRVVIVRSFTPQNMGQVDGWDVASGQHLTVPNGFAAAARNAPDILVESGTGDDTLVRVARVVNVRTGKELGHVSTSIANRLDSIYWAINDDGSRVSATSLSFDVATSSTSIATHTWKVATGEAVGPGCSAASAGANYSADGSSFSSDGATVQTVQLFTSGKVIRCDIASGRLSTNAVSSKEISGTFAGASADARIIATRDDDGTVRLFDAARATAVGDSLRAPFVFYGMLQADNTVAFSPDGRLVTATEGDGEVRIWSTQTIPSPLAQPAAQLSALKAHDRIRQDRGGHVAIGYRVVDPTVLYATLDVVDMADGRLLGSIPDARVSAISDDGTLIAAATTRRQLIVFDVHHRSTQSLSIATLACNGRSGGTAREVSGIAILSNPPTVAVSCPGGASRADASPGFVQVIHALSPEWRVDPPASTDAPDSVTFSPNGRVLVTHASGSVGGRAQSFEVGSDGLRAGRVVDAFNVGFASDNKLLINNRRVALFQPGQNSQPTDDLSGATVPGPLAMSPDGSVLATADGSGAITLWDPTTATVIAKLPGVVGTSEDGSLLFSSDSHSLIVTPAIQAVTAARAEVNQARRRGGGRRQARSRRSRGFSAIFSASPPP